jgi:hypothetical protein
MTKAEHMCQLEEAKMIANIFFCAVCATYTFVPFVQLPDEAGYAEEDEIPCPTTPVIV